MGSSTRDQFVSNQSVFVLKRCNTCWTIAAERSLCLHPEAFSFRQHLGFFCREGTNRKSGWMQSWARHNRHKKIANGRRSSGLCLDFPRPQIYVWRGWTTLETDVSLHKNHISQSDQWSTMHNVGPFSFFSDVTWGKYLQTSQNQEINVVDQLWNDVCLEIKKNFKVDLSLWFCQHVCYIAGMFLPINSVLDFRLIPCVS